MWREIQKTIRETANSYLLAVSGGSDSMFMLNFFRMMNVKFQVAHFNHGNGLENDHAENFVRDYCNKNDILFHSKKGTPINNGDGYEVEFRNQRYDFFNRKLIELDLEKLVSAHHLNDQIETILMRLTKGYPHDNLMMKSDVVFRPFLNVCKEKIMREITNRNIPYLNDSTNSNLDYERNFFRHQVIPMLTSRRNVLKSMKLGIDVTLENKNA